MADLEYTKRSENHYFPHEFRGTFKRGEPDLICEWCKSQFSIHSWVLRNDTATFFTETVTFALMHEDDAFAFRMRWC